MICRVCYDITKKDYIELPIALKEFFLYPINAFKYGCSEYMPVWKRQVNDDPLFCKRQVNNQIAEYCMAIVASDILKQWEVIRC